MIQYYYCKTVKNAICTHCKDSKKVRVRPQPAKNDFNKYEERDNLALDLLNMLDDSKPLQIGDPGMITEEDLLLSALDETVLMTKLSSYIVRRDHKIWNHAYNLGKQHNDTGAN